MKRAMVFLVLLVASCATVTNYPLDLSYAPQAARTGDGKGSIAVAPLIDKRAVQDRRIIGKRESDAPFIALIDEPSAALAKGFAQHLESRGYAVTRLTGGWDGSAAAIDPAWGDLVVGGSIEEFNVVSRGDLVKNEYTCTIRLTLIFADPRSKEIRHKERTEVSTSYTTVGFSREKAEELINKALSEAVERALAEAPRYIAKP
ncbi:MAG: hypothetical protein AB1805_15885 [Nitrospirota bacterium]